MHPIVRKHVQRTVGERKEKKNSCVDQRVHITFGLSTVSPLVPFVSIVQGPIQSISSAILQSIMKLKS